MSSNWVWILTGFIQSQGTKDNSGSLSQTHKLHRQGLLAGLPVCLDKHGVNRAKVVCFQLHHFWLGKKGKFYCLDLNHTKVDPVSHWKQA